MMRSIPIIPTILVVAAAGVMVWLGFWQLGRADEKAAMIERFSAIPADAPAVPVRSREFWQGEVLFTRVVLDCDEVISLRSTAGTSVRGAKGFAHIAKCNAGGLPIEVALGWSRDPAPPVYDGGSVEGIVDAGGKVVANPALADLEPLAKPDPNDLPNNHLAYAGQWFFFALTALVIYGFALKSRVAKRDD
ncbi:SURF1 family cytochrome oxidase biogenesis protein [Erythrobacter sp. JK5]|uniref:SURF1 family cytochrome oxidase biogenesis protein n=1 Tax=Erythrobacter sp. JK5 TaxID=2829500 RepID=UPI001BA502C6|nr:SURF1 family cytochrome oxidase biogenesis protein [Erythrobacter sp. JK5]QUL39218.1 SURF1 family protein [Erythrobacter sp. JK5]